ncbi:midasin [Selaginella moellendorffii]|uniref:midasin n=1 Tax=Selaginella moellendorffii TaxID=88036 RepID=UPI000D1C73E2|nr:midasin [Selaginella moellendorffii]|eukprot:XP_024535665.1 midasin [Selaginella moellendorffii]
MDVDFRQGFAKLARLSSLADDRIAALARGDEIDRKAVEVVQELLVRPDCTVVVAGCFRSVLSEVVSDLVNSLEKRSSSSLSVATHEYVSVAFSKILDLAPFLSSSILRYYTFAPSPFERLLRNGLGGESKEGPSLLEVLRASYQFLRLDGRSFRELWDWSPFLSLLLWTGECRGGTVFDVRWCAVQVLSLVFRMSDAASRDLSASLSGISEEEAFSCLIRWEEFYREIAVGIVEMFTAGGDLDTQEKSSATVHYESVVRWKQRHDEKVSHVVICGVELPLRPDFQSGGAVRSSFVVTPSVKSQMEAFALALSQRQPVLLEGPLGSGKSSLFREFAGLTGNTDVLFIHLDDQLDTKTLFGNYVCTEVPGEFKWQPGTLTQAIEKGLWVVFEDVDKAPSDLFSSLVSLLEDRKLQIPGRGEVVYAAENFRLFATVCRMQFGTTWKSGEGRDSFTYLWRKIIIEVPSDVELSTIIKERFPGLCSLVPKLIGTLNIVKGTVAQGGATAHVSRHFSTRDLLKFCNRVCALVPRVSESLILDETVRDHIYLEAVDCFAAAVGDTVDRQLVMRCIAEHWNVPLERVEYYSQLFKPLCQELRSALQIGRVVLPLQSRAAKGSYNTVFADTAQTMRLLERIARCVEQNEAVLLVGETGTGKTTLVQRLAWHMSAPLTVVNLSQQSDAADLLGGFKPVEAQSVCLPLVETFNEIFTATFSLQKNKDFWTTVQQYVEKKRWVLLLKAFRIAITKVGNLVGENSEESTPKKAKRQKPVSQNLLDRWRAFSVELSKTEKQVEASKSAFAFSFVEGVLVKALKNGTWLLLDEINLAPVEILERLNGIFDGGGGSVCLTERGDLEIVQRHPNFRIFACMNPATDVGKRELPVLLRNRLTELYVDEMCGKEDLEALVAKYLEGSMRSPENIVNFFLKAREEAEKRLRDGAGHKPQYSLRSLSRALEFTRHAMPVYGFDRALYDGVCMSFLTLLDQSSAPIMEELIQRVLYNQSGKSTSFSKSLMKAPAQPSPDHILFEQFWVQRGCESQTDADTAFCKRYVLTKSIKEHLKNIARAVFIRKYPVLLQGPTSSGKTSLVRYLAAVTGHKFLRINNHEHTDLQEYLGAYVSDHTGKLVFQEGPLVEAVRNGYWIVLDELNLAPSDVLEALNRLLDDNRELFVPELQVSVKPHPHFMLFATQNPPGIYGGRKALSRAFRNRFIELHVDDIPAGELVTILEKRCDVAASYAGKMVEVMKDLQRQRQGSKVFAGKHGYITPRDLFRWAERHRQSGISYEDLAWNGYVLLAERIRDSKEKVVVQTSLEKQLRVKINPDRVHEFTGASSVQQTQDGKAAGLGRIVWMKSMRRLYYLTQQCNEHNEPLLLVGETGCGKTTVCQLLAQLLKQKLHILNCHQHTETSDFIGGFRPVRGREKIAMRYDDAVCTLNSMGCFSNNLSSKIEDSGATIDIARRVLKSEEVLISSEEKAVLHSTVTTLQKLRKEWQSLFVWHDGPLVDAMRNGDLFLVDEISLADDSVLERLNSVLEPNGTLVLAEKGGSDVEEIIAHPKFRLMATMNPGGDFGKKELSPALRNRFTEVWVPPICDLDDLRSIILERLSGSEVECLVEPLIQFWQWFQQRQEISKTLSVRDLLSWITYVNNAAPQIGKYAAFIHGAFLVLLDGVGLASALSSTAPKNLKEKCVDFLLTLLPEEFKSEAENACALDKGFYIEADTSRSNSFGIHPFYISKGNIESQNTKFEFNAPTTRRNVMRILRAMQLRKPVLLEGSPGVGKTSLVSALAAASGHTVVRINLSEQTDILDLFGSDLPVEGGKAGEFQWSDGVFLQALKAGNWVLLDELNLASQSVLEGLNSCLDHRGEVFIPELGLTFECPPTFRLFACQNPLHEGGGRKGLPKSFLNRFTTVYTEPLTSDDYFFIARALHPSIPEDILLKMIEFNRQLYYETMILHNYGHLGAPWEFNLRDILRWCTLIEGSPFCFRTEYEIMSHFVQLVYIQRLRTLEDRDAAVNLFKRIFGNPSARYALPDIIMYAKNITVGLAHSKRMDLGSSRKDSLKHLQVLSGTGSTLESIMHCIGKGWMCLLVGPPKSGKTTMVRTLAELTGNSLFEYNMSGSTDTTELLGCFEQHDTSRCIREAIAAANVSAQAVCSFFLSQAVGDYSPDRRIGIVKNILASWSTLQKTQVFQVDGARKSTVSMLKQFLEQLQIALPSTSGTSDFGLGKLRTLLSALDIKREGNVGRFEWIDGDLLRAAECGAWVLLENANLCNPTVLDRLNSLLESSGSLMVNERGLVHGQAMVVKAHPNFRLFLTLDPANGEVSRAMRNRGVELYMLRDIEPETEYHDTKRVVESFGVPGLQLVDAITRLHLEVRSLTKGHPFGITYRELGQWLSLLQVLLERGGNFYSSMVYSWEQSYLACITAELQSSARVIFQRQICSLELAYEASFYVPGGWPSPLSLRDYCSRSQEAVVKRDCRYVEYIASKMQALEIMVQSRALLRSPSGTSALREWLWSIKDVSVHFPQKLLRYLQTSEHGVDLPLTTSVNFAEMEKQLEFAISWALEQAPVFDTQRRVQWLQNLIGKVAVKLPRIANCLMVLEKGLGTTELSGHLDNKVITLVKELRDTWNSFKGMMDSEGTGLSFVNQNCLIESDARLEGMREDGKVLWRRLIATASKVTSLRRWYLQWKTEDQFLQSALSAHQTASPIMQSYLRHMPSLGAAANVCSGKFTWLYPLLLSIRRVEEALVVLESGSSIELVLFDSHESLWGAIQDPNAELDFVRFCWKTMKHSILELNKKNNLRDAVQGAFNLVPAMDAALNVENAGCAKPYLWKYGGHPQVPHSIEFFELEHSMLTLSESLWIGESQEKLYLRSDSKLWLMILEGLSMISCIGRSGGAYGFNTAVEIGEAVSKRLNSERAKLPSSEKQLIPFIKSDMHHTPQSFCSSGCHKIEKFSRSLLFWSTGQDFWQKLHPLSRHRALLLDGSLISKLLPSVAEFTYNENYMEFFERMGLQSKLLHHVVSFSMKVLSRPSVDFVPHQHVMWLLDSDPSNASAASVSHYTHEMVFNWHTNLWNDSSLKAGASLRFRPSETIFAASVTDGYAKVKEYHAKLYQLKIGLERSWFSSYSSISDPVTADLSYLSAVIQQVMYSHKKLFPQMDLIFPLLSALHAHIQENHEPPTENTNDLMKLLQIPQDPELHNLVQELMVPCIKQMYSTHWHQLAYYDRLVRLGQVWLLVGRMRLELLMLGYGVDPMAKYLYKHQILSDKLKIVNIEIQVRNESNLYVRGGKDNGATMKMLVNKQKNIEENVEKLKSKLVSRPSPPQFYEFIKEAGHFMQSVGSLARINMFVEALAHGMDAEMAVKGITAWQDNATSFIRQLSTRFNSYRDVIQPFQLGIYELKYGLSLHSVAYENGRVFEKRGDLDTCTNAVCSLMCFPSIPRPDSLVPALDVVGELTDHSVEKLIEKAIRFKSDPKSSELELKVSVLLCALSRLTREFVHSRTITDSHMKLLQDLVNSIIGIWKQIRAFRKANDTEDSDQIRFVSLGGEPEEDEATFKELFPSYWSVENLDEVSDGYEVQKLVPSNDHESDAAFKAKLAYLQDEMLKKVLWMYQRIFSKLEINKSVSDDDRMTEFLISYNSGRCILEGIGHAVPQFLDTLLYPAHLVKLSLEHGNFSNKTIDNFNIYKDAFPSELSKMLGPIENLARRIHILLEEWPEHPVLLQVMQFVESLLSIPASSPIVKAVSGLELVLAKSQVWEQSASKQFSLAEVLTQVSKLVLQWRRMELESWPQLLENVDRQQEANAKQMWFSFYDLLHQGEGLQVKTIIESCEEFLLSCPIGEFQCRLGLIEAFYLEFAFFSRISYIHERLSFTLYNLLHYYSRWIPAVQDALSSGKEPFSKELADFARLAKWEDYNYHSVVSTAERSHRKLHKIIRKYEDFLKRPVIDLCKSKRVEDRSSRKINEDALSEPFSLEKNWTQFCSSTVGTMMSISKGDGVFETKMLNTARKLGPLLSSCFFENSAREMRQTGPALLDALAVAVISRSTELSQENKSRALKKKALVDLRKSLKDLGISQYKSEVPKDMRGIENWFQQPVAELSTLTRDSLGAADRSNIASLLRQSSLPVWERAKDYYFDNIALLLAIKSSKCHEDLDHAEVDKFIRYMEYMLYLQQKQRRKIHEFSSSLAAVAELIRQLEILDAEPLPKQGSTRHLMWQQKSLLDEICQQFAELKLFFDTVQKVESAAKPEADVFSVKLKACLEKLQTCKAVLDKQLVLGTYVAKGDDSLLIITRDMSEIVHNNFKVIDETERTISMLISENSHGDGPVNILLTPAQQLLQKGVEVSKVRPAAKTCPPSENGVASIASRYDEALSQVRLAGQKVQSLADASLPAENTVHTFESLLEESVAALRLDQIYKSSVGTINHVVKLLDDGLDELGLPFVNFVRSLSLLLKLLVPAGATVLCDYIELHKATAKLGYIILSVLSQLNREGFCGAREEDGEESEKFQAAEGTGMGEGQGTKDVSEQIEDEQQLLGSEDAPTDRKDNEKLDKGIEMEEDFNGEMFDVSEDESNESDGDEDGDEKLESKMGEQGENEEVVDEKMWDKEDESREGTESVEQGQSVKDAGYDDLELRGKNEDSSEDKEEDLDEKKPIDKESRVESEDKENHTEDKEDFPEDSAFEDPSGIQPSPAEIDVMEEEIPAEQEQDANHEEGAPSMEEEQTNNGVNDSLPEDMDLDKVEEESDDDENGTGNDGAKEAEVDKTEEPAGTDESKQAEPSSAEEKQHDSQLENLDTNMDDAENAAADNKSAMAYGVATEAKNNPLSKSLEDGTKREEPSAGDNNHEQQNEAAPSAGAASSENYASSSSLPTESEKNEDLSRLDANPYRSLGSALKKWQQRARMVEDEQDKEADNSLQMDVPEETCEDDTYKYVSNDEKSNAQAMGAATDEQMKLSDDFSKMMHESDEIMEEENIPLDEYRPSKQPQQTLTEMMDVDDKTAYTTKKPSERQEAPESEEVMAAARDEEEFHADGSFISFERPENFQKNSMWNDDTQVIRQELETEVIAGINDVESARKVWQKYEQLTGRLSQDLAEQLRLILEPTLASRLQGDYKSGKRLNMKKIIPFVASEFRKDKIWLRRTKPNKRQYQVVVALDDSRSMSESHCGHMALEALLTICRGMTQLEVGQMAVASFGKKGNVRLLHDLDQPFSTEAAVKIISEFSFRQDNTISDEPMVDLLQYLTRFLNVVATRYAPAGQRDLQQLVLVIADGRFHEKESLRRCVRDALSRRQLLAFLVLDNPQESLLDMQSVTFANGAPMFSKYLDTFPFPYYVILKDIEALPRTLADLLRQWFELMQHSAS